MKIAGIAVIAVVVLCLCAAACGDGGKEAGAPTDPSEKKEPSRATPQEKVESSGLDAATRARVDAAPEAEPAPAVNTDTTSREPEDRGHVDWDWRESYSDHVGSDERMLRDYFRWFRCKPSELKAGQASPAAAAGAREADAGTGSGVPTRPIVPTFEQILKTGKCIGFTRDRKNAIVSTRNAVDDVVSEVHLWAAPRWPRGFGLPSFYTAPEMVGYAEYKTQLRELYDRALPRLKRELAGAGLVPCETALRMGIRGEGNRFTAWPLDIEVSVYEEKNFVVVAQRGDRPRRIRRLEVFDGDGGDHEYVEAVYYRRDSDRLVIIMGNGDTGVLQEWPIVGCIRPVAADPPDAGSPGT